MSIMPFSTSFLYAVFPPKASFEDFPLTSPGTSGWKLAKMSPNLSLNSFIKISD